MQSKGYWYYRGKVYDVTTDTHINLIIDHPELFGFTLEDIKNLFNQYGEKLGTEGKARENLIMTAVARGWIRIRHYIKPRDYWSIQYFDFSRQKKALHDLIEYFVLDTGLMTKNDEVIFAGFGDESNYRYRFQDGGIGKFLVEKASLPKTNIILEKEFTNMKSLEESGLARIESLMRKHDSGTITAFRGSYSKEENRKRNKNLLAHLLDWDYDVTAVKGSYIENMNTPEAKEVKEDTFFVVDVKDDMRLEDDLKTLGEKFEQDSILFIPAPGMRSILWGTNNAEFPGYGNKIEFAHRTLGRNGEFMTKVKNRPFIFESVGEPFPKPNGMMGKWATHTVASRPWQETQE